MNEREKTSITTILLVGLFLISTIGMANAHFTMLFPGKDMDVTPEDYIAEIGDTKTVWIIWGHPYEHILFDMTSIPQAWVRDPKGVIKALTPNEITVEGKRAYEISFIVDKLGDWVVYATYEDEEEQLTDYVKAIIHCGEEVWEGWDAELGQKAEIVPFTRPYGLEEDFVFTGTALYDRRALSDADVEVEMYHTKAVGDEVVGEAEDMFPYDPPMMFTRVTKTNAAGEFAYTLDEPGVWFVGAYGPEVEGLTQRSVFIVPVLDAFPAEEAAAVSPSGLEELKSRVQSLEDKVAANKTTAEVGAPGFGAIAAIAGLLIVMYLVNRRTS
jgi:cobalt/nickel transport protein